MNGETTERITASFDDCNSHPRPADSLCLWRVSLRGLRNLLPKPPYSSNYLFLTGRRPTRLEFTQRSKLVLIRQRHWPGSWPA